MNPKHSSLDARFAQAGAVTCLQKLLHLPKTHRDVADWLYDDHPQERRDEGILSPEVFNRGLGVSSLQSCVDLSIPYQAPSYRRNGEYSETIFFEFYVPVKESNGISLGYSFHTALLKCGSSLVSLDLYPDVKTNRGRYAYNKHTRTMLVLMGGITSTADAMWHVQWGSDTERAAHYFLIPHRQYSFDDQPNFVRTSVSSEHDLLCSSSRERQPVPNFVNVGDGNSDMRDDHHALPNGPADFVDGVWREDNISSLPQCMFEDLENRSDIDRHFSDSSAWLNEQQKRSLLRRHTRGLIQFGTRNRRRDTSNAAVVCEAPVSLLEGSFFSGYVVRETFDENGALNHRIALEIRTRASFSDKECLEGLRRGASQVYYSVVLWASTDQHLVVAQEQRAAELMWGKDEQEDG